MHPDFTGNDTAGAGAMNGDAGDRTTPENNDSLLDSVVGLLDIPMLVLALVSLALIVLEFGAHLSAPQSRLIASVQTAIWCIFILEYSLRLFASDDRLRYLKRNWFDALIVFIPALRVFRVARAAHAIRLLRVASPAALVRSFFTTRRALKHLARTLGKSSFPYVVLTTAIVTILGAAGLFLLERNTRGTRISTYGDALWCVTGFVTTIGTELHPSTAEGRVLSVVLMIYGMGIFGYLAGTLASYFIQTDQSASSAPPGDS